MQNNAKPCGNCETSYAFTCGLNISTHFYWRIFSQNILRLNFQTLLHSIKLGFSTNIHVQIWFQSNKTMQCNAIEVRETNLSKNPLTVPCDSFNFPNSTFCSGSHLAPVSQVGALLAISLPRRQMLETALNKNGKRPCVPNGTRQAQWLRNQMTM